MSKVKLGLCLPANMKLEEFWKLVNSTWGNRYSVIFQVGHSDEGCQVSINEFKAPKSENVFQFKSTPSHNYYKIDANKFQPSIFSVMDDLQKEINLYYWLEQDGNVLEIPNYKGKRYFPDPTYPRADVFEEVWDGKVIYKGYAAWLAKVDYLNWIKSLEVSNLDAKKAS